MKIEIKNVKHYHGMSQETNAFDATLYIEGQKIGRCSNQGFGGPNDVDNWSHPLVTKAQDFLKKQIVKSEFGDMNDDLDFHIGRLVGEDMRNKEIKKILRRVSYLKDGKIYQLPAKVKPTEGNLEQVKKAAWWKGEYLMLSGMTFDNAKSALEKVSAI